MTATAGQPSVAREIKRFEMKKLLTIALTVLAAALAASAQSPAQILAKAAGKINSAPGIDCTFTARTGQGVVHGSLKASGKAFAVETNGASTWYDGKTMWTANHSTEETIVSLPTPQEIAETNPLSYLSGYSSLYNVYLSKRKEAGKHLVLLNPKKRNTGIKAVEIAVNAKSMLPERLIIRQDNDQLITVNIGRLNLDGKITAASLAYPESRYKGYETIDMR